MVSGYTGRRPCQRFLPRRGSFLGLCLGPCLLCPPFRFGFCFWAALELVVCSSFWRAAVVGVSLSRPNRATWVVVLVGFQHSRARGEGGPLVCCSARGCVRPLNFLKNRRFSDSGPILRGVGWLTCGKLWGLLCGWGCDQRRKGRTAGPSPTHRA